MRAFHVKTETKPSPQPHVAPTTLVSIYEGDQFLGSYERLYPAFGESTFCPFESGGRWYALYSGDYTTTRVLSLPACQDLGGEDPEDPQGFCPVEYYVPRYRTVSWSHPTTGKTYEHYEFDNAVRVRPSPDTEGTPYHYGPWQFLHTGFVAGCQWGDDATWKVEVLDLSRVAEGVITRAARFGYCELPQGRSLPEALDFGAWTPNNPIVTVVRQEHRNLTTGNVIDL